MSRAEYMRAYRKRRKDAGLPPGPETTEAWAEIQRNEAFKVIPELEAKIETLEAEVKHLKAELAQRTPGRVRIFDNEPGFNSRPFTPAPKKGK